MMKTYKFGDVVLIKFPYTNKKAQKKRPALILNDFNDGDIVVCRITSKIYGSVFDLNIENWEEVGLKLPSIVRVHKIATLDKNMVDKVIGKINGSLKLNIKTLISKLAT